VSSLQAACNKICNKYHLLHLVGILFPHNYVTTFSMQFAKVHKCVLVTTPISPHANNKNADMYVNSDKTLMYFSSNLINLALK